jgi:hypothetical protein
LNDKDLFPDYEPKKTPDTVHDYLRKPNSFIFKILKKIGDPSLENLTQILAHFNKYKRAAEKNPGGYQEGNVVIGADAEQYYPSEEELLVSELGKMIKEIITMNSKKLIENAKQEQGILSQTIVFHEIIFRHVDVMGSGRFFFAEKRQPEIGIEL